MALININEAKTYHAKELKTSDISKISNEVNSAKDAHSVCVAVARYVRDTDDKYAKELLIRLRYCKSLEEAQQQFYTYLLSVEGCGILKEYNSKVVRYKGTAIGGMECHSPR